MAESLESILDIHPDLIARMDTDFFFTYVNQSMANFWGAQKETLLGMNLVRETSNQFQKDIARLARELSSDRPTAIYNQVFSRNKQKVFILWEILSLYDQNVLTGYQFVGRNVTTRMRLNQQLEAQTKELQQVEQELRFVLDAVPSMIWYKDDQNTILRLNQSAADSMSMRVEDVEGQNTYDLFGDAAKAYHEADLQVFASGEAIRGLVEPYTPNEGEQGWVQTDKIPLDNVEGEPRLLVVSTDITELKEQEAILQSINENLDDFASLVSHDLQAPLRKIAISAELMQLELGEQLPAESKQYFDDIWDGVIRMREMTKSFLSFMRSSPHSVGLKPLNLNTIIEAILADQSETLAKVNATVSLPEQEIWIKGEDALLRQVFANLIENAIKYRSEDRQLSIDISAKRKEQFWKIDVCDNGIGVDPASSDKIFDLFGRAKPHMGIKGSGVGLALCRRIITLHGGTITLREKRGTGSCFQVILYRAKAPVDG